MSAPDPTSTHRYGWDLPPSQRRRWLFWIAFAIIAFALAVYGLFILGETKNTRETLARITCASNLRSLDDEIRTFVKNHNGRYPNSLAELTQAQSVPPSIFSCPCHRDPLPPNAIATATEANILGDYRYEGGGLNSSMPLGPDIIIATDTYPHRRGQWRMRTVLFADGRVELSLSEESFQKDFQRSNAERAKLERLSPASRPTLLPEATPGSSGL